MAEAMLLGGGLDFVRFGGDMANSASYSWRSMRGPTGLRPPRIAGSWDPVASNGWGTSLSGSISTILTILSWICAGIYMCAALPSPVCA